MSITFFIHLTKKLNGLNNSYFSNEEIKNYALDYYCAYRSNDNYIMNSLIEETSSFSELDYYTNLLTK